MRLETQIANLLRAYYRAKNEQRKLRVLMLDLAITELGVEQKETQAANIEHFLDGYLVGKGVVQSWRNSGCDA